MTSYVRRSVLIVAATGILLLAAVIAHAEDNLKFGKPGCPGTLLDKQFFVM